jgi:hypothetical protein
VRTLVIVFTLLALTASANARDATKNCFKVDEDNSPAATLSGRITDIHKMPRIGDLRPAKGPYINLDMPLRADVGGGCKYWRKIPFVMESVENQHSKWQNRRVAVSGRLGRFGSALVYPPIYIEGTTIKGK